MNEIFNFIKNNALVIAALAAMVVLGIAVNKLISWNYITGFFVIFRHLLASIDWIWPTPDLIAQIALIMSLKIILWAFEGGMFVINKINKF